MMLLGIDSCGAVGTIALARSSGDTVSPFAQTKMEGKTFAAQIAPALREILAAQGLGREDIEAIVVVNGPGSFTGVRIGVSSAKALAEALGVPLLAVSRLAVLAFKANTEAAALDAGRGEFYFRRQTNEALVAPEEIRERLHGALAVCEESAARVFSGAVLVDAPTAAEALVYAAPRLRARDFDDVAALDGNYVRRSDAELFAKPGARLSTIAKA
jgi:tRNA threonylcarbamoyladenosine biosynthesis protein TsaB